MGLPNRADIITQVRQRVDEGRPAFEVRVEGVDDGTLVVSAAHSVGWEGLDGAKVATRATIADGLIIRLEQFRTYDEALAAVAPDVAEGER